MKKELPNLVFDKQYDNFYLYTEFDVIFNENFYHRLIVFIQELGSNKLTFKLEDSLDNISIPDKWDYVNPTAVTLSEFYEKEVEFKEKTFPIHCINHFVYDENHQWEIYVSLENELCIFACNDSLKSLLNAVFTPYREESLEVKCRIIGDMFKDKTAKEIFLTSLERNYRFTEY